MNFICQLPARQHKVLKQWNPHLAKPSTGTPQNPGLSRQIRPIVPASIHTKHHVTKAVRSQLAYGLSE